MNDLPPFQQTRLLAMALTHRSYLHEHPDAEGDNERLEFLGDAVLNCLAGEFLFQRFPHLPEGDLTPLRSALVDETQLAQFAIELNLGSRMRVGKGADRDGARTNPNLLSSTFEAVIGAYFLDCQSDIRPVRAFVVPFFAAVIDYLMVVAPAVNYKSRLQQWALANLREMPKYQIVDQAGADHAKEFTAIVAVAGRIYGQGKGRRKQDAEKAAARQALEQLGLPSLDRGI